MSMVSETESLKTKKTKYLRLIE